MEPLQADRARAVLLRSLCQHAQACKDIGPLAWILVWYHPECFEGSNEKPDDEMNVAMSQAIGWTWGPF